MVIRKALDYVIRTSGAYLIPRAYQTFKRYDVATTNRLFGKSGGKGFRHGRDVGLLVSDYLKGDDLDPRPFQPSYPPGKFSKARNRYRNNRGSCRCGKYGSSNRGRQQSYPRKRYTGQSGFRR